MPDKRPRGYQPQWRPRPATLQLLAAVDAITARYEAQLPLTLRQVFYICCSDGALTKVERDYKRLVEVVGMGRRSGRIDWDVIRDDTEVAAEPVSYDGPAEFRAAVLAAARDYRLDRQKGQPVRLEIFCETAGMVQQLVEVADPFGVPVYSGSGYNGLNGKRDAARRAAASGHQEVRLLVISDWDPSGFHLFKALREDVTAFAAVDAPGVTVTFERLAVTEQQIADHQLPTAPPKASDRRSFAGTTTTQAEALRPDILASVVRTAILTHHDQQILARVLRREQAERAALLHRLDTAP